ncbi:MAG: tetratricopeptide repeat protein, partial [Deltaproteobacteria bacterium]|nr:tetratricopeptide repeat protein [Deltaproteobacteria bacterium]
KVCARELAARVVEARSLLGTAPAEAVTLLESTCTDDPSEPTFRLELAEAQIASGRPEQALATLAAAQASGTLTRPLRSRAAHIEASVLFRAGRRPEAEAALARAIAATSDEADARFAKARQRALLDKEAAATLGRVLFGDERGRALDPALAVYLLTEFAQKAPEDALGPYLVGRQLATRDPKLAVPHFVRACSLSNPDMTTLDPIFRLECRRLLVETAYLAGDMTTARFWADFLSTHAEREADRLRAQDYLERIAWKAAS